MTPSISIPNLSNNGRNNSVLLGKFSEKSPFSRSVKYTLHIVFGEFCRSASNSFLHSSLIACILCIIFRGSNKQMPPIGTTWMVTGMANKHTFRNRTNIKYKGSSVGSYQFPSNSSVYQAVSLFVYTAFPSPAFISDNYLFQKPFWKCGRKSLRLQIFGRNLYLHFKYWLSAGAGLLMQRRFISFEDATASGGGQ